MSFGKGQVLPVRTCQCRYCGATVQRKSYWRNPSCAACTKKRNRQLALGRDRKLREQARRYRILLAVGPYKTWEELYQAVKIRNPRGWAQSFDMSLHRKNKLSA